MTFVATPDKAAGDAVTLAMWEGLQANFNAGILRPIAHTVLGATSTGVTFSSIAADWVDLLVVCRTQSDTAVLQELQLRLNGDTAANYHYSRIQWASVSQTATANASGTSITLGHSWKSTASGLGLSYAWIHNYQSTSGYKNVEASGNGDDSTGLIGRRLGGMWLSTSAVTSVTVFPSANSFQVGSMFTLYGVAEI